MNYLEFSHHNHDGMNNFNAIRPGRNLSTGVHIPEVLDANQYLSTKDLTDTLKTTVSRMATVLKPLSEEGWKDRAKKELEPLANTARKMQKTAIARANELNKKRSEWLVSKIEPAKAAELRSFARKLKAPDVIRQATKDGAIANAVLQNPHGIAGLDDPALVSHVERAAILYNIEEQYKGQTHKAPAVDDILAHGVDKDALKQIAEEALKNYEQWLSDVSHVESVLSQVVNFYALAADIKRPEAFDAMGLGT